MNLYFDNCDFINHFKIEYKHRLSRFSWSNCTIITCISTNIKSWQGNKDVYLNFCQQYEPIIQKDNWKGFIISDIMISRAGAATKR